MLTSTTILSQFKLSPRNNSLIEIASGKSISLPLTIKLLPLSILEMIKTCFMFVSFKHC